MSDIKRQIIDDLKEYGYDGIIIRGVSAIDIVEKRLEGMVILREDEVHCNIVKMSGQRSAAIGRAGNAEDAHKGAMKIIRELQAQVRMLQAKS